MGELLACRLCLSTNVKLFNMYKYRLDTAYEDITGLEMSPSDVVQHACSMCSALLLRCNAFVQSCRRADNLLSCVQPHMITIDYIQSLKVTSPHSNIKIEHNNVTIKCSHEELQNVKDEVCWSAWNDYIKAEDTGTSDEEPLATKVVKKSKKANVKLKKHKKSVQNPVKIEENLNLDTKETNIDNVLVKAEDLDNDNEILDTGNEIVDDSNEIEDVNEIEDNDFKEGEVDVIILTKEQQIEEIQARKTSTNYLNSFYKCELCFKGFITDATYKNHMIRHDPRSGAHECGVCYARWAAARALRAHVAAAHERRYRCRLCHYASKSRHKAKEHSNWHSGHSFTCQHCGATFAKSTSHLTHVRVRHPSRHACALCGERFIGRAGLNMHVKKAHWDVENTESRAEICCNHCNTHFRNVEALSRHTSASEGGQCDLSLRPCAQCGEGLRTDEEFKEHLKMHSREEPIKCEECDRTFPRARALALHRARAHAPAAPRARARRVVCEICGKSCPSNATLRYHQRTHTGERPYQCTECPKRFSIMQRLQIHQRTHTGERPYKCVHCPKAFKHKAALNRHDRVHTGVKPYACSHCGKTFSQSNSMKLHIRTVHLKMPSPYRSRRMPAD